MIHNLMKFKARAGPVAYVPASYKRGPGSIIRKATVFCAGDWLEEYTSRVGRLGVGGCCLT